MGDNSENTDDFLECGEFVQLVGRRALELDERWSSEPSAVISAPQCSKYMYLRLASPCSAFVAPSSRLCGWFLIPGFLSLGRILSLIHI